MSNPFYYVRDDGTEYHASPTEWRDGVPGYSDADLEALAACVCDGEWVHFHNKRSSRR